MALYKAVYIIVHFLELIQPFMVPSGKLAVLPRSLSCMNGEEKGKEGREKRVPYF